jgi:hypothetical protein
MDLKLFLKENKIKKENEFYRATQSLKDENGNALEWEIRRISTKEDELIREECMKEIKGRGKIDYSLYMRRLAAASVVNPSLYNAELQDSYGVKTPEELLVAMIDSPGEYQEFIKFIQRMQGFDVSMKEKVDRAKN